MKSHDIFFEETCAISNKTTWQDVGVYPTPHNVVQGFTKFTLQAIRNQSDLEILDLFAGDGRLGLHLEKSLPNFVKSSFTFLEIRENALLSEVLNSNFKVAIGNGFEYKAESKFDVVVSNPPYLAINSKESSDFGIDWEKAQNNSKNLYALGISKALELCKPGGIVSVIAPFAYLRGYNSALFRANIEKQCSEVKIRASSDRTLFENANQDIAFQLFKKRCTDDKRKTKWKFAFDDSTKYKRIHVNLPLNTENAQKYVRVGPVVWNRKARYLSRNRRGKVAVIYGGNILHSGKLDFDVEKYREKQYISRRGIIPTDIISAPFIAIRRTLRGKPGSWIIDSVLIEEIDFPCTGENHVIIIELPAIDAAKLNELHDLLIKRTLEFYNLSGSPNISTKIVGELFSSVMKKFL